MPKYSRLHWFLYGLLTCILVGIATDDYTLVGIAILGLLGTFVFFLGRAMARL